MSWFREKLYTHVQQAFEIKRELHKGRTPFQAVTVFENPMLGRVLTLDGICQTTEADEFVYHEMMTHVPILAHGRATRVLIVGGGDGGILRETLRHRRVKRAVMVEIDGEVVELCRRHLPSLSAGAFEDRRAELVVGDGAQFMASTDERFDVMIIDSTDPMGPGEVLFRDAFYRNCKRCLKADGIVVTQNGVPFFQREEFFSTGRARAKLFGHSGFYFAAVPTYYGGHMAMGWASPGRDITAVSLATLKRRFAAARLKTRYYNPEMHLAAFARPNYLKSAKG
ncbi:MAG: polyamine aminopropyltransferase [Alphaproteobacteria bacterium]|nr:polyamine aminopropyltransferase [Alphaproteobacteria bacterium]